MPEYDVLTYTRPDGGAVDLSNPPFMTISYDGFGISEFDQTWVEPPGMHGGYWYDTRMSPKILTVHFSYYGAGVIEKQNMRETLVNIFNPLLGPGWLQINQVNGTVRKIKCILTESLPLSGEDMVGVGAFEAVARFKSHGIPAFIDLAVNTATIGSASSGANYTFPWTFPRTLAQSGMLSTQTIVNAGNIDTPIRIVLSGPLANPSFKNITLGKNITLNVTLLQYDVLTIDTDPENYVVQINGTDAWQYLTDPNFWSLAPGNNTVVIDVGGTTAATVGTLQWYSRYLGQ